MPRAIFVRHSQPEIAPEQPPGRWPLSASGRIKATQLGETLARVIGEAPVRVIASAEAKAVETAELLGLGPVHVDDRLGEVAKPWYPSPEDHRRAAIAYLSGQPVTGWESQVEALNRFASAFEEVTDEDVVVVTHGTVLSLWLTQQITDFDPGDFWLGLGMPDAYEMDGESGSVKRVASGWHPVNSARL